MKLRKLLWIMLTVLFCFGLGAASGKDVSASTDFKPIRGVRRTLKNVEGISAKKKAVKKVKRAEKKLSSVRTKLSGLKKELSAYEELQEQTEESGTLFADNGCGTELFDEVACFDPYFEEIKDYGNVNENLLNSESLSQSIEENDSLYMASLVSDQENPVTILQTADMTDTVDIGSYLSYRIYKEKNQIKKTSASLEKVKKKVRSLRKKSKGIVTKDIVFNAENVTEVSNISVKKMKKILKGTKLERYADVYVRIEKEYGINAIVMCALSAYESGWGESRRAVVDHNYTGFGVYSDSARGINASSGEANLLMTAKHLAKNYLKRGQVYYHGVGLDGLNRCYSTSGKWAYDIEHIGMRLMKAL